MKKVILFAAILFAGVSVVKADGITTKAEKVNLTVTLQNIQSITVDGLAVDLLYDTQDKYSGKTEVSVTMEDHITVFSTGDFKVTVESTTASLMNDGTRLNDDSETDTGITIATTLGSSGVGDITESVKLSNTPQTIISTTNTFANESKYTVKYIGEGANKYREKYKPGDTATVYQTDVLYTITAI